MEKSESSNNQNQTGSNEDNIKIGIETKENNEATKAYDFYLLIYNIAKKHNIGTLIRSASAFNIKKVLVLGENKKILKKFFGSQGTVKKTEFLFFTDIKGIKDFCKENNIFICGIEIGGESKPVHTQPFKGNTLFVLGNEGSGMNNKQKEMCDHLVYIPQYSSKTGSLNVAIAASIVFHHFAVWANYAEATFTEEKYDVEYQKGNVEYKEIDKSDNFDNDIINIDNINKINEDIIQEIFEDKGLHKGKEAQSGILRDDIHRNHVHRENGTPLDGLIEDFENL